jgi:hypothetical protein
LSVATAPLEMLLAWRDDSRHTSLVRTSLARTHSARRVVIIGYSLVNLLLLSPLSLRISTSESRHDNIITSVNEIGIVRIALISLWLLVLIQVSRMNLLLLSSFFNRSFNLLLQKSLISHLSRISLLRSINIPFSSWVVRVFYADVSISVCQQFVERFLQVILVLLQDSFALGFRKAHVHQGLDHWGIGFDSLLPHYLDLSTNSFSSRAPVERNLHLGWLWKAHSSRTCVTEYVSWPNLIRCLLGSTWSSL